MNLKPVPFPRVAGFVALVCLGLSGCGRAALLKSEDVQTMIDFEKDRKEQAQMLAEENRAFEKLKKALRDGRLKTGLPSAEVSREWGAPLVTLPEDEGERWVYRAGKGGFFGAPKIYLFFDRDSRLKKWKCLRMDCPK